MNFQTRSFPYLVLALLCSLIALYFMFKSLNENSERYALDRNVLIAGKEAADSISAHWENESKAEHERWVKSDKRHKHELDSSAKTRKGMIRKERSQRLDTATKTLTDTIYLSFENDLLKSKEQRKTDSLSHMKEVETLQQSKLAIKEYADSTFTQLLTTNDKLISALNKVEELKVKNKVVTWVAVLEAVGIVILALLL